MYHDIKLLKVLKFLKRRKRDLKAIAQMICVNIEKRKSFLLTS